MFDSVVSFFLGNRPDALIDPAGSAIWYVAKILIGVMLFDALFDIFRFLRRTMKL